MENREIIESLEKTKVSEETALSLKNTFMPFFEQANEWKNKAKDIVVTSGTQIEEMDQAREARLALKKIRVNVETTRKELKEEGLRKGKAIDGMANIIKYLIVPIEEHLQKQEDFVKIQEAEAKAEVLRKRIEKIESYGMDSNLYNLSVISDEAFQSIIDQLEQKKQEADAADKKAEEEKIAKEKADAEEQERIREENARLKKEADERDAREKKEREEREAKEAKERKEREAKEAAEREAYEAKIKKEREEKEKAEAELKAAKEAEEKEKRDKEEKLAKEKAEEERKKKALLLAPDREKLNKLATDILSIEIPLVKTDEAKAILKTVQNKLNEICSYIKKENLKIEVSHDENN